MRQTVSMRQTSDFGDLPEMGPSRVIVLPILTAALLSPGRILPRLAGPAPETGRSFRAIFEQYQAGRADGAVEEFSRWDAERVEREATLPPDTKDLKSLAALALLYTEAGMKNDRFGLPVRAVVLAPRDDWHRLEEWRRLPWPSGGVEAQKDLLLGPESDSRRVMSLVDFDVYSRTALRLIRELVREGRKQKNTALLEFCLSWYIVTGSFVSPFHPSTGHMPLRRAALVDFGDHPEVLLLTGSYSFGWQAKQVTLRHVLALDPLLVEARVRLGDLLHRLRRNDEASSELERAVREAHAAGNVAMEYLGRLFLGRVLEDARRMKEAETSYKTAAALNPHWQAARVALGTLWIGAGDWEDGSAAGRVALELSMSSDPDPWYLYTRAQYWQAGSRVGSMRMAVRP
jgi:tetratricopeptide (TPR) repeat protein